MPVSAETDQPSASSTGASIKLRVLAGLNVACAVAGAALVYETLAMWPDLEALGPKGHYAGPAKGNIYFMACLVGACVVLLVVSALGYLQRSERRGRRLANAFGALALCATVLRWLLLDDALGAVEIAFAAYAIATVALVNTIFKPEFIPDSEGASS